MHLILYLKRKPRNSYLEYKVKAWVHRDKHQRRYSPQPLSRKQSKNLSIWLHSNINSIKNVSLKTQQLMLRINLQQELAEQAASFQL